MHSSENGPSSLTSPGALEQAWKNEVEEMQQMYFLHVGPCIWYRFLSHLPSICSLFHSECDCYYTGYVCENESELNSLRVKIAFSMFGQPKEGECVDHVLTMYNADQRKVVEDIFNVIMTKRRNIESRDILFGFVFVFVRPFKGDPFQVPVFRIPNPQATDNNPVKNYWFIDHSCRIYKGGWSDYLKNNELPKGLWCYPENGIYTGDDSSNRVKLSFKKTPACSTVKTLTQGLDIGVSVTGAGAGIVGVFGAFTPLAPAIAMGSLVGAGITGVYSIVRSSIDLADRGNHGQSVGLTDRKARRSWFCIAGSALGLGAGGGMVRISTLAARGELVSRLSTGIVTSLNVSSAVANGIGIADSILELSTKFRTKGKIVSPSECMQLAASVLFFFNSVINMKTARAVLRDTQNSVLEFHEANLQTDYQKEVYNKVLGETMAGHITDEAGKAAVIRDLHYISNVDEAYSRLFVLRSSGADGQKIVSGNHGSEVNGQLLSSVSTSLQSASKLGIGAFPVEILSSALPQSISNEAMHTVIDGLRKFLAELVNERNLRLIVEAVEGYCSRIDGKWIFKAINMVTDFRKCRTPSEYLRWACFVVDELKTIFEEIKGELTRLGRRENNFSENSSSRVPTNDCLSEGAVLEESIDYLFPGVLFRAVNKYPDEFDTGLNTVQKSYHFPSHRSWGCRGELELEEYERIAECTLGLRNVDIGNIHVKRNKACVFVEGKGVVEITSHIEDRVIVVKTIRF